MTAPTSTTTTPSAFTSQFDPSDLKIDDVKVLAGQGVVDIGAILDGYAAGDMDSTTLAVLADLQSQLQGFAEGVFERHGSLNEAVRSADHTAHMRLYGDRR